MPFSVASLTSGQYDKLRGTASVNPTYAAATYISICPNNNVYTARVNGAPSGTSYAQINYDTGSGTLANVRVGMTVLISHTNDRRAAFFVGRVRKTPTSSVLYINETSATVADNDYIFILDDYRLFDKLARDVSGVQYKDYDLTFRAPLPQILNLQAAYCGWISNPADTNTKFRVAFNITAYAVASGASISSYAWTLPATATVVSGATNTAAVTVDFASSPGDWVHVTVTDSNGNSITRHTFIHAASDIYPPLLATDQFSYRVSTESGVEGALAAFSGVDSLLDNTLVVAWDVEYYNGTEGAILNPVKFVGRFRQANAISATDEIYSLIQDTKFTLEGASAQLARIESLPRALLPSTSAPGVWDTIQNLTPWRAIAYLLSEHSTFCELFDLNFSDLSDTFLIPQVGVQGSSLFEAVRDLATSINAVFEFAPQGEARAVRDAAYLSASARNSLLTVANFTPADWLHLEIVNDPITNLGSVPASGAFYNSSSGMETPLLALAPGVAQEIGANSAPLTRQYLESNVDQATAQAELNARAGHHFARNNARETVRLRVTFPDGYNFLVPSVQAWYTWTIAATDNVLGLAYDTGTRWLLLSLSVDHENATGTKQVTAEFLIETSGPPGQTVQYPALSEIPIYLPDIPAFGPFDLAFPEDPTLWLADGAMNVDIPPQTIRPDNLDFNGNMLLAWSATHIKLLRGFLLPTVTAIDITPDASILAGMNVVQCLVDPFYSATANTLPVYALLSDGTNSKVIYTPDAVRTANWQDGSSLSGQYTVIRATNTPGKIWIYAPATTSGGAPPPWEVTWDFSLSQQGWVSGAGSPVMTNPSPGQYVGGTGWATTDWDVGAGNFNGLGIWINFSNSVVATGIDIHWYVGQQPLGGGRWYEFRIHNTNTNTWEFLAYPDNWGGGNSPTVGEHTDVNNFAGHSAPFDGLGFFFNVPGGAGGPLSYVYSITLRGDSGSSPIVPTSVFVAQSSNHGSTFSAPIALGNTPGAVGGFDIQAAGPNRFAAVSNMIRRDAAGNGVYADYYAITGGAQAVCVIVPYFNWAGASQTSATNPDIIVALNGPDGSGRTLLWIEGGATPGTVHDITPVAGITFDNANCVTVSYNHHIAVFGKVSGVYKLYVTTNRGSSWSFIENLTTPTFIRCRRSDNTTAVSNMNVGQLYLCESGQNVIDFSGRWGAGGLTAKDPSLTVPVGFDTVF